MKNLSINISIIIALFSLSLLSSCATKEGFSLAQLNQEKDITECQLLLKKKKYKKALTCFEAVKSQHYGEAMGTRADLAIADTYFRKKEFEVAAEAYRLFIEAHPYHAKVAYAYYKAGISYLKQAPKGVDRDQSDLDSAIKLLETAVKYYGHTPYAKMAKPYYEEARLKQAKKHFYVGRFYYKNKEFLAAIPRFQTIITEYAKLGLDEQAFYYLIKALTNTEQKDLARKIRGVFEEHYPHSSYLKRLK
ncbi:MAG: outer membrane protein assembly factor BamD [bacterium]|nr:outer membrane protein assembly factor BamD [bacterium]MBU1916747.1 outer membrane protein assembly factor BamD [bacterium]